MKNLLILVFAICSINVIQSQSILINYEVIQSLPSIMQNGSFKQSLHYDNTYSHSPNIFIQSKHIKRFNAHLGLGAEFLTMKYSISDDPQNKIWGYSDYFSPTLNSLTTFINVPIYISYNVYKDFYVTAGIVNSFLISESRNTPWSANTYQPQSKFGIKYSFFDILDLSIFMIYSLKNFAALSRANEYSYIWQVPNATTIDLMRAATISLSYKFPLKKTKKKYPEIHTEPVETEKY